MGIKEKLEIIIDMTDKASAKLKPLIGTLGKVGKSVGIGIAGAAGLAGAAVTGLSASFLAMAKDAATIAPVQDAFEKVADASGAGADKIIAALREKSNYMIEDIELMKNYSTAAQLVGTDFANQLPDAMQYLGKVAAATGQDMGFMMDSLVKGVGRMSPMILDNLGIQVNLTEATDKYAASIGKEASELTKAEQQAALMADVLEKLKTNTESMSTATDPFKQLQVMFTNLKTTVTSAIGTAIMPSIEILVNRLGTLLNPEYSKFFKWLESAAVGFAEGLGNAIEVLAEVISLFGHASIFNFQRALNDMGFTNILMGLGMTREGAEELSAKMVEFINYVSDNVIPVISDLVQWFKEQIPPAIEATRTFIVDKLIPAIITIATWVKDVLIPALIDLAVWFSEKILPKIIAFATALRDTLGKALAWLKNAWDNNFAGIRDIIDNFATHFKLIIELVKNILEGNWRGVGETMRKMLDNILEMIKEIDWKELGTSILKGIGAGIKSAGIWLIETLKNVVNAAIEAVKGFLGIESPSRVMADQVGKQMALGIGEGMQAGLRSLTASTRKSLKPFVNSFGIQATSLQPAYASSYAHGSGSQVIINYQPAISFADEFELEQRLKPIIQRATRRK